MSVALSVLLSGFCSAGPNEGGVLMLHASPEPAMSLHAPNCYVHGVTTCPDLNVTVEGYDVHDAWVLAIFPTDSAPRVTGVTLSWSYPPAILVTSIDGCGEREFPYEGWPASGTGTTIGWNTAQTSRILEVIGLQAYCYSGEAGQIALAEYHPYPPQFVDDSIPGVVDTAADVGKLGFNTPGYRVCPDDLGNGACCMPDGTSCELLPREECERIGGIHLGTEFDCDPNLCAGVVGCGSPTPLYTPEGGPVRENAAVLGPRPGGITHLDARTASPCGSPLQHHDDSFEYGYAWQYGGVRNPYYGAFAECYVAPSDAALCNVVLWLTQTGWTGPLVDAYAWSDDGGCPGGVICARQGVNPGAPAFWPAVSKHDIAMDECCVSGPFWVGFWGDWPNAGSPYFIGADLDGPGGCPKTCIAPGQGFPSGWQHVSVAFGPTRAIGIGAELAMCQVTATRPTTWGRIKTLYYEARPGNE